MAILYGDIDKETKREKIHYNRGDIVRAETINDIQDTAIDAHNMATEALDKADSVFQGNGTVVSVGGREVGTLAFSSDPQQQLDTLNSKIDTASSFNAEIVDQLPTENISTSTFYLIKNSTSADDNTYSEYLYVNGKWELLGNTQVQAYDDSELRALINNLSTTKADKSAIPTKLPTPNTLTLKVDGVTKAEFDGSSAETVNIELPNTDLIIDIVNEHSESINEINTELAGKADKSEIPSISGLATETYVNTQVDTLQGKIDGKQDTISDLETIRSGASAGATAVQPSALDAQVSTLQGKIDAKYTKPVGGIPASDLAETYDTVTSVNNKTTTTLNTAKSYTDTKISELIGSAPETLDTLQEVAKAIKDNEDVVAGLNSAIGTKADKTTVDSLEVQVNTNAAAISNTYTKTEVGTILGDYATNNDLTGKVDKTTTINTKPLSSNITLSASDVGALPDTTLYGASLSLTMNDTDYKVTAQLKDQAGNNLGTAQTIDLPLESVVVSGSYDATNKKVILTLKDGSTIDFSVADLIDGLASQSSVDAKYTKPSTGIPKTDLASDVQTSLGKADTALQSIPSIYVTDYELNEAVSTKADQSALDETNNTLTGVSGTATSNYNKITELTNTVTSNYNTLNSKIVSNDTDITNLQNNKANITYVDDEIDKVENLIAQSTGTTVTVGTSTVPTLTFDSNPQTQIDNKIDKVSSATANNLSMLNADGTLADSGLAKSNVVTKDGNETITGQKTFSNNTYFNGVVDIEGNVTLKNNATLDNSTANTLKIMGSNTILLHEGSTTKNGLEVGTSSISPYLANPSYNLGYSSRPFANLYLGSSGKIYKGSNTLTLPSSAGTLALTTDIPDVSGKVDYTDFLSGVGSPINVVTPSFLGQTYVDMETGEAYVCFNTENNAGWVKIIMPSDIKDLATKDEIPTDYVTNETYTSGLNTKADKTVVSQISNPNLVINGDFRINQRGDTTYSSTGYTVDRWQNGNSYGTLTKSSDYITFSASGGTAYLIQRIEDSDNLVGKTVTLSVCLNDGTIYSATDTLQAVANSYAVTYFSWGNVRIYYYSSTGYFAPTIHITDGNSVSVKWIKLELGSVATPYSIRPYAEELAMCQRYYQKMSFTGSTQIAGGLSNGGTCYVPFRLSCDMRVRPTVTITGSYNFYNGLSGGSVTTTGFSVGGVSSTIYLAISHGKTNTGATVAAGTYLSLRMLNGSTLELDAEI